MVKELTEVYYPEKILFRESQIQELDKFFQDFKKNWAGKNIVLQGNTGNGKTLLIDTIRNNNGNKELHLYAKAQEKGTAFQLFRDLFNIPNSNTLGNCIQRGIQKIKQDPKILIIEELNRLSRHEIKTVLSCCNEIVRETEMPICIVTNIFGINQYMRDDQKSSLQFYFIDFPPYSEEQLFEIFKERMLEIKKSDPDSARLVLFDDLKRICNFVYEKGIGYARQVRKVLNECIISNDFSDEKILSIIEGTFDESCYKRIANMSQSDKNFLKALLVINKKRVGTIYEGKPIEYSDISKALGGISIQRISYFTDLFEEEYHLIRSEYPGGRGRKRLIYLDRYFFDNAVKQGVLNIEEFSQKKVENIQ